MSEKEARRENVTYYMSFFPFLSGRAKTNQNKLRMNRTLLSFAVHVECRERDVN